MTESIIHDVLCIQCQRISSLGPNTWKTHSTLAAVRLSAANDCHLCSLMLHCLTEKNPGQLKYHDPQKLYLKTFIKFEDAEIAMSVDTPPGPMGYVYTYMTGRMLLAPMDDGEIEDLKRDRLQLSFASQIDRWKETCLANHPICSSEWKLGLEKRRLPTRLLDVGVKGEEQKLCLTTTEELHITTDYLTLSHCWGTTPLLSLRTESYSSFLDSIPITSLPRTFRDAVELVRDLGQRYLWIDSLCIIQDSHEDWLKESSLMCDIYSHALLNLAASSSSNGEGGLLPHENSLSAHPCLVNLYIRGYTSKSFICYPEKLWSRNVEDSPLGKRAWVLQERLLSSRIIHFGSGQIFWECRESIAANNLPSKCHPEPGTKPLKMIFQDPAANGTFQEQTIKWNKVVAKYSACNLTFNSDKLVAISGLASLFAQHLEVGGDIYLAGLWKSTLPGALLWYVDPSFLHSLPRGRVEGRAPSWSWACVDGVIQPGNVQTGNGVEDPDNEFPCRVLDVSVTQQSSETESSFVGCIRLQGLLAKVTRTSEGLMLPGFSQGMTVVWDEETSSLEYYTRAEGTLFFPMSVMKMYRCTLCSGLMLKPTGLKRGQFQRVGYSCGAFNPSVFLQEAKDLSSIGESLYEDADVEKGFIFEIV